MAHSSKTINEAKVGQNLKKFKFLILYLGYNDMVKKTSYAAAPLKLLISAKAGMPTLSGTTVNHRDANNCSGARYSREASNSRDVPNNRDVL